MKKFLGIFLAMVTVCALCLSALAEANTEDGEKSSELFWVTHYQDGTSEGAGVIFTEEDTAGGWWIHVAFRPVGTDGVYEIVEITNGLSDGKAEQVAVPKDGFVWAANYGNDYISLGSGDTDYTSENCSAAIARAEKWSVGQQFRIDGIDFQTVPTDTPDLKWYDEGYVCTATITAYQAPEGDDSTGEKDPLEALREELISLVGEMHSDAMFAWEIQTHAQKDGTVTVELTINDIAKDVGLQGVAGQLHYNPQQMTLLTESNKENELQCVTALPSDKWENMSRLVRDDAGEIVPGLIELSAVNATDSTVITDDTPVVFSLHFSLADGYTYSGVYMPTESVYGLDTDVNEVVGNGAYAIVEATVPEEESSQESSAPPKPGDGGIVWFAVLGAASLVGALAAWKKRRAID